jgi:hypothetical protein
MSALSSATHVLLVSPAPRKGRDVIRDDLRTNAEGGGEMPNVSNGGCDQASAVRRPPGGTIPGKFDVRHGDRLIVDASRTPFCDGARVLLAEGIAVPGDMLIMRHAGSDHDALKASVGVAAKLTVNESSGNGTPRFVPWRPMPSRPSAAGPPMRGKAEEAPGQPSGEDASLRAPLDAA